MAYAAITCLMRTINQSMELTGCDLQPFYAKLESLRAILDESYNVTGDLEALTSLEVEIAEVAYSAEDMVDWKSIDVSSAETSITRSGAFWKLCCSLDQEVERIDSIMKKWMAIRNWYRKIKDLKAQTFSLASTIPEHAVERPEHIMVGHENAFKIIQDQLTGGERELEVVSIVGMGGIGKTTLATKLYSDPFIMSHFDIRTKATVSQEYYARNVLLSLLSSTSNKTDDKLADQLQKHLKGNRYLLVIDDIWTTGAWDDMQLCFPNCNNGSRVLLTTRNVEVAEYASSDKSPYHMDLLNFDESWNLLYKKVFVQDCFPPEFEQLGKQIASKCGGLPLAIIVIGGLLSKIGETLDEWQSVAKNVSSVVSTDLEAQCMRVLALSYHHLPSHLKPCFLYFAIFPEDELISADKLVELWAVEGFLKVEELKSIEEVAETCLNELIDRSLISVHKLSFDGKIESCRMHDVTRELCLREAQNVNFVNFVGGKSDQNPCAQSMQCSSKSRGRISIHNVKELARCRSSEAHSIVFNIFGFSRLGCFVPELPFKLVRVLDLASISCRTFPSEILHLMHLRFLALCLYPLLEQQYLGSAEKVPSSIIDIPPSISRLCYLQTFILYGDNYQEYSFILPSEILTMPQLRHLRLPWNYLRYYEPTENSLVLRNLQCLFGWNPLYCTGSAFRLFPNLKKLQISGAREDFCIRKDQYDFRYLHQLEELEFNLSNQAAKCFLDRITPSDSTLLLPPPDAFPQNLKNLTLKGSFFLPWKDLSIVGKLPKLESLQLINCRGEEWEVAEEGFPHLKFLKLSKLHMRYWRASSDHFPCLERLFLEICRGLDSIPQEFADITTLTLIDIDQCRESVGNSAKQIQQDIQDNYGGSIDVHIRHPL
ncbi:putative late blight resistance protein homolog R1A-10 isoform X2 [Lycium ferocissimum]|uniref:putative late blight resistance protein homolog R1A-10 isoform X2 n=1 Tax=Lycium ferocissimum TaxID=112874 RepID=UPI002814CCF7|nr:putative late blight resistance protein homolog R1A-10 isoform X2 [Lycium ferocissimum]